MKAKSLTTLTSEEFNAMEVKPENLESSGYYFVTMFQFNKIKPSHPDYIKDWLLFSEGNWDYCGSYAGNCYVCFLHKKATPEQNDHIKAELKP
jgi:hypothetical protein